MNDANLPAALTERANLLTGDQKYLATLQKAGALTEAQWDKLESYFMDNAAGPIQPSIICKGQDCSYVRQCPLAQAKVPLPFDEPCVVEETVKRNWAQLYYAEFGRAKDGYAAVDRGVIIDLMNTMLDIKRAQDEMANSPEVAERVLRGFDKENNPIVELKMNPLHFYLKNARLLKQKLLGNMVATRDARAKDKSRQTESTAQFMTELKGLAEEMAKKNKELMLREAEATVIDQRDVIGNGDDDVDRDFTLEDDDE